MIRYFLCFCAALLLPVISASEYVNLARGKKVLYAVEPDNPKDTENSKLTDGKWNLPPGVQSKAGYNDYFDESQKDYSGSQTMHASKTVGWHWKGSGDIIHGIPLVIDLGKAEVIKEIRVRAASFTRAMYRFSLPREFIFTASLDGKDFYRISSSVKVTANGIKNIPPQAVQLKVYENRNRWITVKANAGNINARYIGLIVKAEGFMYYLDELEIQQGKKNDSAAQKKLYTPENREIFTIGHGLSPRDAVVLRPMTDKLYVPADGVFAPAKLFFRDLRKAQTVNGKKVRLNKKYCFNISLPENVELHTGSKLFNEQIQFTLIRKNGRNNYYLYDKKVPKKMEWKSSFGKLRTDKALNFLFFYTTGPVKPGSIASFSVRIGHEKFTQVTVPVEVLNFPAAPRNRLPASASITWMPEMYSDNYPEFFRDYKRFGFNGFPLFSTRWKFMPPYRSDFSAERTAERAAKARAAGLDIIQVDSPLHTMVWSKPVPCTYKGARDFCISYRGEIFQKHLAELETFAKASKPDMVIIDIELMGRALKGNPQNLLKCERCAPLIKKSGLSPREYVLKCGDELYKLMKKAYAQGAVKNFRFGQYDLFAGQSKERKNAYHFTWDFDRNYPKMLNLSMPALYTAGLFDVNHRRIRSQYESLKKNWVVSAWVTPGTYGYCAPEKMEHLTYEHILNGGNIMLYGIYDFYSPLQMYGFAKAFSTLDRYTTLLNNGKPDLNFNCSNAKLAGTKFKSDKESLIYIANYSSPETEEFTLNLSTGSVNAVSGKAISAGKQTFKLAPAEFILIHQKH